LFTFRPRIFADCVHRPSLGGSTPSGRRAAAWCVTALAAFLAGCISAPIDPLSKPPEDWPVLLVRVHTRDAPAHACLHTSVMPMLGCTVANFEKNTCDIYLKYPHAETLEHERLHCLGYDHAGEHTLRNAWASYQARRRSLAARAPEPQADRVQGASKIPWIE
jgi:hypothetical protein